MCKGGRESKHASYDYRVEYMEAGQVKVAIYSAYDIEGVKETVRFLHKNSKVLSVCLLRDYKELYAKYSDIMNPVEYKR